MRSEVCTVCECAPKKCGQRVCPGVTSAIVTVDMQEFGETTVRIDGTSKVRSPAAGRVESTWHKDAFMN